MSITTDSQVTWIRQVNGVIQEMNSKIFRQLMKHVNLNGTPTGHAIRLPTGVFSLVERETNTDRTNHVVAYAVSGQIHYLNAQKFHDQRADWYAVLDNAYANSDNTPGELLMSRIAQVKADAKAQLSAGNRNLLYGSGVSITAGYMLRYGLTEAPNVGDTITVTLWGTPGSDRTGEIGIYNSYGYTELFKLTKVAEGVYQGTGQWMLPIISSNWNTSEINKFLNIYFFPNSATQNNSITRVKMEYGSTGTAWTPAPEEVDVYP